VRCRAELGYARVSSIALLGGAGPIASSTSASEATVSTRLKHLELAKGLGDDTAHGRGLGIVLVLHGVDRPLLEAHAIPLEDHHMGRATELEVADLGAAGDGHGRGAFLDDERARLDHARRHFDHANAD